MSSAARNKHGVRVGFVSLGCPKALVDSERILTQLRAEGYELVGSHEQAELVVVNTCGFINEAISESLDAIGEAIQRNGPEIDGKVFVEDGSDLKAGEFAEVIIQRAGEHDLWARLVA